MIELYTTDAAYSFLAFFILGFSLGLIYDFFSAVRISFPKKIVLFLTDFSFCILTALLIYLFLIAFLSGEFRVFAFAALAAGFLLYSVFLASFIRKFLVFLIKGIGHLLSVLLKPLKGLIKKIKINEKIRKILKKLLKKLYDLMYNKFIRIKSKGRVKDGKQNSQLEEIEKYFA